MIVTPHEDANGAVPIDEEIELELSNPRGFSRASAVLLALLHAFSPVATEHVALTSMSQSNLADGGAPITCTNSFCSTRR